MDIVNLIHSALPGSSEADSSGPTYRCERCDTTYDQLTTPCEQCGSDVLADVD